MSLIVRLRGPQATEDPQARTATASLDSVPSLVCRIGGLRLVVRDAEAMHRLFRVAQTTARLSAALWPVTATDPSDSATQETTRPRGQLAP